MNRIDTSTADIDKFGTGKNGFTAGDPGSGTPPTDLDEGWFDAVQEELAAVVEGNGTILDPSNKHQVHDTIRGLKAQASAPAQTVTASATQTGLDLEPLNTATGNRAPGRIGPQKGAFGSKAKGDFGLLEADVASPGDAKLAIAASATQVDRYVPQVASEADDGNVTSSAPTYPVLTIPANTLRKGSVVTIDVGIRCVILGGEGASFRPGLSLNGLNILGAYPGAPNYDEVIFHLVLTFGSDPSATAKYGLAGTVVRNLGGDGVDCKVTSRCINSVMDTTVGITIAATLFNAGVPSGGTTYNVNVINATVT